MQYTTTKTKAEKKQDQQIASANLHRYAPDILNSSALLLITQRNGTGITDYLQVSLAYIDASGRIHTAYLTWSVAQVFGYVLRDRDGRQHIAMSGGGYSKADEIARSLGMLYGVDRVRYELN